MNPGTLAELETDELVVFRRIVHRGAWLRSPLGTLWAVPQIVIARMCAVIGAELERRSYGLAECPACRADLADAARTVTAAETEPPAGRSHD